MNLNKMTKVEIEAYAKKKFGVDLHRGLSKENLIEHVEAMASKAKPEKAKEGEGAVPNPAPAKDGPRVYKGDLTLHERENAVQIVALTARRHGDTSAKPPRQVVAKHLGMNELSQDDLDWAWADAKKRSPGLYHEEIVAKAIWP